MSASIITIEGVSDLLENCQIISENNTNGSIVYTIQTAVGLAVLINTPIENYLIKL